MIEKVIDKALAEVEVWAGKAVQLPRRVLEALGVLAK